MYRVQKEQKHDRSLDVIIVLNYAFTINVLLGCHRDDERFYSTLKRDDGFYRQAAQQHATHAALIDKVFSQSFLHGDSARDQ